MVVTRYDEIVKLIDGIDPVKYGRTRNFIDGAVTKLSPYISRGIISTKQIAQAILAKNYRKEEIEIFLKELAWRDYYQQVWIAKQDKIDKDLKQPQTSFSNYRIPEKLIQHRTGIKAIDNGIKELYTTGYMHNHVRMYVASICTNIARCHWFLPARWMYYYLLDADWASNALSWQWVAGSFSSKKYYANQENINKYCYTNDKNTFLDLPYEQIINSDIPSPLKETKEIFLKTILPDPSPIQLNPSLPTYIYNFYNLDPQWDKHIMANRVLLLEPGFFHKYPVSNQTLSFLLLLAKNVKNIQVYTGSFNELYQLAGKQPVHFKEHPTNNHYTGVLHHRPWMFEEVRGYFPSFFSYWNKCELYLN